MIPNQRSKFNIPDDIAYLNCGYLSPQLKAVSRAGADGLLRKETPWEIFPEDFFDESETLRGLAAEMVGATADHIAIVPSASYGIAVAAANVELRQGQQIVILDEQFPSNVYCWMALATERDAKIVKVERSKGADWTGAICSAITEKTAVAAVPNCHWTDGSIIDLVAVGRRCREVGAALVIDGTQAIGTGLFPMEDVKPDFLATACYKWLLGPYGTGFLYAADKYHAGRPIEYNWINRRGSEDFSGLTRYRDEFQDGARRFDVGQRSNFTMVPMVTAALSQIKEWGLGEIQETIGGLTAKIESRAGAHGWDAVPVEKRVAHIIGIYLPETAPDNLVALLAERRVFVSKRGRSIRVSPHVHNTQNDIDRLFDALAELLTP